MKKSPSSVRPELVEGLPSSPKEDKDSTGPGQAEKGERRRLGVRFG